MALRPQTIIERRRVGQRLGLVGLAFALALAGCEAGMVYSADAARDGGGRDATNDAVLDGSSSLDATAPDGSLDTSPATDVVASPDASDAVSRPDGPVDVAPDVSVHVCPSGGARDCSMGTGTGMADQCHDAPSCYVANVQNAVRAVISAHPTWFDMTSPLGCPVILDVPSFMNAVVANLTSAGLCAIRDPNAPNEEVTVKHDNAFSENFDIVASTGCARYGSAIYTGYCAPAWW